MNKTVSLKEIPVTVYIYKISSNETNRRQHELGEKILREALQKGGIAEYELQRTKKGKPLVFAKNTQGAVPNDIDEICHVSLSHTAGYVVCALCKERAVGVDVEVANGHRLSLTQMRRTEKKLLKKEFESKIDAAEPLPDARAIADRTCRFYERWTLAEAFGKMKGVGLSFSENYDTIAAYPHETKSIDDAIISVLALGTAQEVLTVKWEMCSV